MKEKKTQVLPKMQTMRIPRAISAIEGQGPPREIGDSGSRCPRRRLNNTAEPSILNQPTRKADDNRKPNE